MRIGHQEVSGEWETLDHRRARLRDLLASGHVAPDLEHEISRLLAEVELRMWEINQQEMMTRARKAA